MSRVVELMVRILRPSARRLLLRAVHGGAPGPRWLVTPPALGSRCLPGCSDASVDWDGTHSCRAIIGRVALPHPPRHGVHGAIVEVTRDDLCPEPVVWLIGLDERGRYDDDGLVIDGASAAALGELFATALAVAGYPPHGQPTRAAR